MSFIRVNVGDERVGGWNGGDTCLFQFTCDPVPADREWSLASKTSLHARFLQIRTRVRPRLVNSRKEEGCVTRFRLG